MGGARRNVAGQEPGSELLAQLATVAVLLRDGSNDEDRLPSILEAIARLMGWTGIALLEDQDVRHRLTVCAVAGQEIAPGQWTRPLDADLDWIRAELRGATRRFSGQSVLAVVAPTTETLRLDPVGPRSAGLKHDGTNRPGKGTELSALALVGTVSATPPSFLVVTRMPEPKPDAPLSAQRLTMPPPHAQTKPPQLSDPDVMALQAISAYLAIWLVAARRTRQLDDERSFFAATVHQLRNSATPASGFAQVIGRQLARGGAPTVNTLNRLITQVERLSDEIDTMQQAAQAQRQTLRLDMVAQPLAPLARAAVDQARVMTTHHQIEIIDPIPEVVVQVDRERLLYVLNSVLRNAIIYTKPEGTITVAATVTERGVNIIIEDSGIGIAPQRLPEIFEPYYRAPEAVNAGYPGSGLGLYISQVIMRLHDGQIVVESQLGVGTCVTITLPIMATQSM